MSPLVEVIGGTLVKRVVGDNRGRMPCLAWGLCWSDFRKTREDLNQ